MENQNLRKRRIQKVAVLGSGVMGSRIACHFANIGLEVLLLDIVPSQLNEAEQKASLSLDSPKVKNRIVNDALKATLASNPAALYRASFSSRIQTGNFEDDLSKISGMDWVLEAVVENLEIKQKLYERVEQFRKPGTLISSNTSGIPLTWLAKGLSEDFQAHFCGTHFFNPPRYLPLLEIIPTHKTLPEVVSFLDHYGKFFLGKTTVICKDTPAFIANRIGVFSMLDVVQIQQELGLSIEEVDKLTGPVIGHPKSATFRTADVVGIDTLVKVADGLNAALKSELLKVPDFIRKMLENKWLGDKSGQGFYAKKINEKGEKEFWTLDGQSLEYIAPQKAKFATLEATKTIEKLAERWKVLAAGQDKAGEFYRKMIGGLLWYASLCVPEIADEPFKVDDALEAGFGWEMGPFKTWDCLGLECGLSLIRAQGKEVPAWILKMRDKGISTFYKIENGVRHFWHPVLESYQPVSGLASAILLDDLRRQKPLFQNAGATLHDLGDEILGLEFHTKMNTLGSEVIEGLHRAFDLAEKSYSGLVIGNQGANFSAGANLGLVFMNAMEQEFDEIDFMIRQFQNTVMRVRYSSIPVVLAPHGLSLGGGCELTLHADRVQAAAETYMGLVEVGVGVIPGGGGTKEMALRVSQKLEAGDPEINALQNAFMNIATAKVSTSGHEIFDMGYLQKGDRISVNKTYQIADAKNLALELARAGYTQPIPRRDIKVQGRAGMATFQAGIYAMKLAGRISDHDQKVVEKLSYVINGGDLSYPQMVSEQYLLDLEREAFLSLTGERKTLERIQSLLTGGKVIRN
jgi:3-hydroxyacyl-CoA dehydrogenase